MRARVFNPRGEAMGDDSFFDRAVTHTFGSGGRVHRRARARARQRRPDEHGVTLATLRAALRLDVDGDGFADGDFTRDGVIDWKDVRALPARRRRSDRIYRPGTGTPPGFGAHPVPDARHQGLRPRGPRRSAGRRRGSPAGRQRGQAPRGPAAEDRRPARADDRHGDLPVRRGTPPARLLRGAGQLLPGDHRGGAGEGRLPAKLAS